MYLKTWYDPMLEAPHEPRVIDDSPPPPAARPLVALRRRTAGVLIALGHRIAPESRYAPVVKAAQQPAHNRV